MQTGLDEETLKAARPLERLLWWEGERCRGLEPNSQLERMEKGKVMTEILPRV